MKVHVSVYLRREAAVNDAMPLNGNAYGRTGNRLLPTKAMLK